MVVDKQTYEALTKGPTFVIEGNIEFIGYNHTTQFLFLHDHPYASHITLKPLSDDAKNIPYNVILDPDKVVIIFETPPPYRNGEKNISFYYKISD